MVLYARGQFFTPEEGGQVVPGRGGDPGHGTVMQDEPFLGLFADAFDFTEHGSHLGLAPQLAMEGDAEPVRLVADLLQQLQRL